MACCRAWSLAHLSAKLLFKAGGEKPLPLGRSRILPLQASPPIARVPDGLKVPFARLNSDRFPLAGSPIVLLLEYLL